MVGLKQDNGTRDQGDWTVNPWRLLSHWTMSKLQDKRLRLHSGRPVRRVSQGVGNTLHPIPCEHSTPNPV